MSIYDVANQMRNNLEKEQNKKLKIALFGQPGSGKSSIINKLLGDNVAHVGISTDKTIEAQIVPWGKLLLVDLPGYGTTKFPENEFINQFNINDYDLYLCVFSGKFHQADTNFFSELRNKGQVCLFVRNFHDTIWGESKDINELEKEISEDVFTQVKSREDIYFVSCKDGYGIKELSEDIYNNIPDALKVKWAESAKAYSLDFLETKKKVCERNVLIACGAAITNAINPLPGVDVGIEIAVLLKLFQSIRNAYGLTDETLNSKVDLIKQFSPIVNRIIKYGTKEGIPILLKKYAGKQITKSVTKYVIIVGPLIAATIGFAITRTAGISYLEDCHSLAKAILENELSKE